ncbi:hypothetical protein BGX34_003549 [Mortierella sp. NVP85]|nr:hypothetical protein BGX34_003549 [Mortierella sp. NVP85]
MDKTGFHCEQDRDSMVKAQQDQQEEGQEQEQEQEYDRYKNNPQLLAETFTTTRLFSFDWASGFVSPFRPSPEDILSTLFSQVNFSSPGQDLLVDLGCGDAKVLVQALKTFPPSRLVRAVGVDLDQSLLHATKDKILQEAKEGKEEEGGMKNCDNGHGDDNDNEGQKKEEEKVGQAIIPRLELYCGDITTMDDPLECIMSPSSGQEINMSRTIMTIRKLLQDCSHVFVYLLPSALTKLAPILLEAVKHDRKVVMSMEWPIPELAQYQVQSTAGDGQFYVYHFPSS